MRKQAAILALVVIGTLTLGCVHSPTMVNVNYTTGTKGEIKVGFTQIHGKDYDITAKEVEHSTGIWITTISIFGSKGVSVIKMNGTKVVSYDLKSRSHLRLLKSKCILKKVRPYLAKQFKAAYKYLK